MKRWKGMSLLAYGAELLILAAAVFLVIRFAPDFGRKEGEAPGGGSPALESSREALRESGENEEIKPKENGGPPDSAEEEPDTKEKGRADGKSGSDTKAANGKEPADDAGTRPEPACEPPTLIVASDLHYQSPAMTDFMGALDLYTEWNDGTVVPYLDPVTDAFLEEVMMQRPSALILSGDISQNGERLNHEALAKKLRCVKEAGIPVLVIPGNHDISHPWSATYFGDETKEAEGVDADGFYEIYHEFGYDQSVSADEASLSYLYCLDDHYWLMMLDSCIYEPVHMTGGRIREETLSWMREQLVKAGEANAMVIPVAHHNLLKESALYQEECTLENGNEVTALLEEFGLPVYLSGHMHLQRIKKHISGPTSEESYGIYEIVSSSLGIPPCQYGILEWDEEGNLSYHTKQVDVSGWAGRYQEEDENLLDFKAYSEKFLVDIVANQAFLGMEGIPEERKLQMAELYGIVNSAYCSGQPIDAAAVRKSETYLYWSRYSGAGKWFDRLTAILRDTKRDHNALSLKAGIDFPAPAQEEEAEPETQEESKEGTGAEVRAEAGTKTGAESETGKEGE